MERSRWGFVSSAVSCFQAPVNSGLLLPPAAVSSSGSRPSTQRDCTARFANKS